VALACSLLTAGGCSFFVAQRPPPYYLVTPSFECTASNAPAVIDTVFASTYGLAAVGNGLAGASGRGAWFVGSPGLSIMLGLGAALFATSAARGYTVARECREAVRRSAERGAAPGP
jgi:hypothetical protein